MAEQNPGIFRERSLERISSPDQLTDYLRVTNPGIWVLLATVIALLAGILAWSTTGNLETLAQGTAFVRNGSAEIVLADATASVQPGMTVRLANEEYPISTIDTDDHGRPTARATVGAEDGTYSVQVVLESMHPIQFLLS